MYLRKLGRQGDFMEVVTERPQGGENIAGAKVQSPEKACLPFREMFWSSGWVAAWMEGGRFILCPRKCAGTLVLLPSMRPEDPDSGWASAQTFQVSEPK